MTFLGKILVVIQVALSIVFMAFAGAIYTAHTNWKSETEKITDNLKKLQIEINDQQADADQKIQALTGDLKTETDRANRFQGLNGALQNSISQLNNDLETARTESTSNRELAKIAGEEAQTRDNESKTMRVVNEGLHETLDERIARIRTLEDDRLNLERLKEELSERHKITLSELATLKKALKVHGVESDPKKLKNINEPPPEVEGLVLDTRRTERNGTQLIEISIGSDDGLAGGHELFVYRTDGRGKFLGKIVLVYVDPDRAVGRVVDRAKNGIIQRGDNVSTRL